MLLTDTGVTAITVGANTSTGSPYIFAGNALFGPDLTGPVSGQSLVASDIFALPFSGGP